MKALTIRQPWAFAIAEGFKTVENRSRRTRYTGPLLIHAGKAFEDHVSIVRYSSDAATRLDQLGGRSNFWDARTLVPSKLVPAPPTSLALSAVIAVADLTGCHFNEDCCAPWGTTGRWHWELANVRLLPAPVACPGVLGLWTPSTEIQDTIRAHTPEPTGGPT